MCMRLQQNDLEHLQDLIERGEITVEQANVEKVKMARVQLVINSVPSSVRKQLSDAVARGDLGHMKKDGLKPEAYYHPDFEHLAVSERKKREREIQNAAKGALA